MEIVEAKKLVHKELGIITYFKIPKYKSWWDICYDISQDTTNVYGWLDSYEVSDCHLLESNNGDLFELKQVFTEN